MQKDSLPAINVGRYWNSTQVNASMAKLIDFTTGEIMNLPPSSGRYVRTIRTF